MVPAAEYVNVDSQYLAWILSSGWLSSSKSRCYETHWNCAVGLAAILPSTSHLYQLFTRTSCGKSVKTLEVKNDLLKTKADIASQSREILQTFVWWGQIWLGLSRLSKSRKSIWGVRSVVFCGED